MGTNTTHARADAAFHSHNAARKQVAHTRRRRAQAALEKEKVTMLGDSLCRRRGRAEIFGTTAAEAHAWPALPSELSVCRRRGCAEILAPRPLRPLPGLRFERGASRRLGRTLRCSPRLAAASQLSACIGRRRGRAVGGGEGARVGVGGGKVVESSQLLATSLLVSTKHMLGASGGVCSGVPL